MAVAVALIANAVLAQTSAQPATKPTAGAPVVVTPTQKPAQAVATTPAAQAATEKVQATAPIATPDPKTLALDNCKKKGLAGQALDECVKTELAKAEKPAAAPSSTQPTTK